MNACSVATVDTQAGHTANYLWTILPYYMAKADVVHPR